jgi:membrane fusion protein, multidrug efflux system
MNPILKRAPILGLITVCFLLISCNNKSKKDSSGETIKTYSVLTLQPQDITLNAQYPATLEGRQNVEIRPKIDGYIDAIYVDEGAVVRKGQLLFRISNPQYEEAVRNATAAIGSAEAAVETAQLEVEKVKPLVTKEIVSQYELESAKLSLKSKKAALVQAKAELANAKANLGYAQVTSPANGVIGLIPYKIGALVSSTSTDPLTTVSDISSIYAYFSFDEKQMLEFSRTIAGRTMNEKIKSIPAVSLILSDGSLYQEEGKVDMVSGQINSETGSSTLRASFPNPTGLIRNGGSATLLIPRKYTSVLIIPQSATTELQDKRFAYTVDSSNKVKSVQISTTASSDGLFFIVTEGLKAGDRIVLEGVSLLKENSSIQPKTADATTVYQNIK